MLSLDVSGLPIFIVDGDEFSRNKNTNILLANGFEVSTFVTPADALAQLQNIMPRVVLANFSSQQDRPEYASLIRHLKENDATRFALVLALGSPDDDPTGPLADHYVPETTSNTELVNTLHILLRLEKAERELYVVEQRKDSFLATLAHELRNPLAPILNSVELLRKLDPQVPPMQEKARTTIKRQTKHLVRLVDDLMDVSRIARGKIILQKEPVELKTFINHAVDACSHFVESRDHQLHVQIPEQQVWIQGDQARLTQIVSNLLTNATKYTTPGGQITLAAEADERFVTIRVSDNGMGIAEENLGKIFDLFSQQGRATDRVQDGLGIGLTLVRNLVEMHGGEVKVSSPGVGQGSCFEVVLPVNAKLLVEVPMVHEEQHNFKRVLIVDDNIDVADTLAQWLKLAGHEVYTAYTGASAIDATIEFKPEIVLLDIGLPDLNGYDVALRLRSLSDIPPFLLVAVTGYGQASARETMLNAGFDEHFVKPMGFKKLGSIGLHV
jgi:two-component system, sensor histidine kinase